VRPLAIRILAEPGSGISGQQNKMRDGSRDQLFDVVITVCDQADETCQVFFGAPERRHRSFPARGRRLALVM